MSPLTEYRGRFAPSPTGPLHFGSLIAAVGSYLEAKKHNGAWLVRMEDLDAPRCVPGAADDILRTLEAFCLNWDETVLYQSRRTPAYEEALQRLQATGAVYPCACTRKEIADSALHGIEGQIYPGTCRNGIPTGREGRAWRVRTNLTPSPLTGESWGEGGYLKSPLSPHPSPARGEGLITFDDALQDGSPDTLPVDDGGKRGSLAAAPANGCSAVTCRSRITQNLEKEIGDFVVKRADGLFAYQLAVVVDDAFQGITHVVRGADLLASTPRQIYLQRLLGLATPSYMHLPIAVNAQGEKLSKQTLAAPVDANNPVAALLRALHFLRQEPPEELAGYKPASVLGWAAAHWDRSKLAGIMRIASG